MSLSDVQPANKEVNILMATLLCVKRRADEDPSEHITIKSKRARTDNKAAGTSDLSYDDASTNFIRVGTVNSKDESVDHFVSESVKKGWQRREEYKRLGGEKQFLHKARHFVKKRAISNRYKIITQSRGIEEPERLCEEIEPEGAVALPPSPVNELVCVDAVLANESDDVITCNGVPLERTQYVYDVYYADEQIDWAEFMEHNTCEIEKEVFEDVNEDDIGDVFDDEDDENDESNWRNDYPDYDDSPFEDDEEYLNAQIRKLNQKNCESDSSYDADDYDDDGFDVDGNLIESYDPANISKLMKNAHLDDDDDSDSMEEVV
ncbi:hypothetical protein SK128_007519 [Halocaridina rubra]|uniref:Probable RNA polymerase II nuclear localization protein SLC7A6OS n=1 Tax=Halocaridina rubra TaxID=373956 RepID=A0AAN8X8Z7_HALRR